MNAKKQTLIILGISLAIVLFMDFASAEFVSNLNVSVNNISQLMSGLQQLTMSQISGLLQELQVVVD